MAEYQTNSVDGLIEDVTLDLQAADIDTEINIQISRDTESAAAAIEDFVSDYNDLISFIDTQTAYNTETEEASPLLGNRNVSNIKNTLGAMVTEIVPGLDSSLNRFSQIGIDIDSGGKLTINSSELNKALSGDLEGVDPGDISRLFGLSGDSSSSGIEFLAGSTRTESSASAYEVDILQAAERGSATATIALASSITIDSSNNEFQLSVDGLDSDSITLSEGTYTQEELAAHLESRINGSASLLSSEVAVTLDGGALKFTSQRYGTASEISGFSGTSLATLGLTGSESGTGQDVAGSFIVDGVVETATGSGRILIGDSANENTGDLQIRVTLDSSQVDSGVEGTLAVSRGISARLDKYFGEIVDPDIGTLKTVDDDFELRIDSLDESIARVNAISEAKTQYLIEQFAALETVLSELQNTQSFLASQLG